jgi:hypothetical protein
MESRALILSSLCQLISISRKLYSLGKIKVITLFFTPGPLGLRLDVTVVAGHVPSVEIGFKFKGCSSS